MTPTTIPANLALFASTFHEDTAADGRLTEAERRALLGATWAGRAALARSDADAAAFSGDAEARDYRALLAMTAAGREALRRRDAGAGR